VEPLAPTRYKVRFTASTELRDKLERLQALMCVEAKHFGRRTRTAPGATRTGQHALTRPPGLIAAPRRAGSHPDVRGTLRL
jgi:hypothetical protein